MIAGMIKGTIFMMGAPVIRNAVTGAIIERIMPTHRPKVRVAIISIVLTIGPVINTEMFLKIWLTTINPKSIPAVTICLVVIFFIIHPPKINILSIKRKNNRKLKVNPFTN